MLGGGLGCGLNAPAAGCGVSGKTFGVPVGVMLACSATFGVTSAGGSVGAEALSEEEEAASVAGGAEGAASAAADAS